MKPYVPYRWVEILSFDHAFEILEMERMPDYGFTGVTLWSSFNYPVRDLLDNYNFTLPVVYRKYADLNKLRDQALIGSGIEFLRDFSRRAHKRSLTVMHTYHLCNFVGARLDIAAQLRTKNIQTGLRDARPEWFNAEGEIDFSQPHFYEFMAAEVEDFFDACPQVDGLFCWNCECSAYTPSRLKYQTVSKADIVRRAMKTVYEVCQRRGKIMTHDIHTAGGNVEQTAGIIAAAAECPELILGADATYPDWHIYLPTTRLLGEMRKHNRIYVGFDASGEFFGQGRAVGGWPRWLTKHFNAAKEFGLAAISVRNDTIAKDNSCVLVPMLEFNLHLIAQLAQHGTVDIDAELQGWWQRHFSGELPAGMKEVFLSFEDYIEQALYINGNNITEYNPDHGFPRKAVNIAPKFPVWHSEQFTPPGTPLPDVMRSPLFADWTQQSQPIQRLRQEKLNAIAICDDALAKVRDMKMAAEDRDYFIRCLEKARDFAEAFLLTINVVYPLYQILGEHYDKAMTDPKAVLRAELAKFLAHADAMEQRWGPEYYRKFTPKMREFAADIPKECLS